VGRSDAQGEFGASSTELDDLVASDAALRIALARFGRFGLGARVREGVLLTCGPVGSTGPYAHAVLRLRRGCTAQRLLTLAGQHAAEWGTPVAVWIRRHADGDIETAARTAGYALFGDDPVLTGMVARGAPASSDPRVEGTVTRTQDPQVLATLVAEAFGERGISVAAASALVGNPRLLSAEGSYAFVAVRDGQAVACAMAYVEPPYGALSYIGTVPAARRRGVATEVTMAAMRTAIDRGATRLGLQASKEGKGLYQRLGFAAVTEYTCYLVPPSPVR
jgi:ribosomal protein S18 acetylase RimI-like enzyme